MQQIEGWPTIAITISEILELVVLGILYWSGTGTGDLQPQEKDNNSQRLIWWLRSSFAQQ